LPNTTLRLGNNEGYNDAGVIGLQDAFPTQPLDTTAIRRLTETRMCALANANKIQDVGVPSWNDVMFAHRRIYAATRSMGGVAPNLLVAYSPAANLGYDVDGRGAIQGTTETDETGKTVTLPASSSWDGARTVSTAQIATVPLAAGTTDNLAWVQLCHIENSVTASIATFMYARYTDANNWLRLSRQSATNVRLEKDVAAVVTTEADFVVSATEPFDGSAYALRINGTLASVYCNGLKLGTVTLSAGAQALVGLLTGQIVPVSRGALGELEVWSTNSPYYTK
jgi:hypothetical protein